MINNQIAKILEDLKLQDAPEPEQKKALQILQDRMNNVMMQTLISLATPDQKNRITDALNKNEKVDETISDVSSEIPQFAEALEQSLLAEYESIKQVMQSGG